MPRVASGETIEVTDRGRPVALLVPTGDGYWEDLITTGRVAAATTEGSVLDELPGEFGIDASGALAALRDDER